MEKIKAFFKKLLSNKKATAAIASVLAVALIAAVLMIYYSGEPSKKPVISDDAPPSFLSIFGVLFDGRQNNGTEFNESQVRPIEDAQIPFENTRLSRIFDTVDKHYLYISSRCFTLSDKGFVEQILTYAIDNDRVYICQQVGYQKNHFISKSDGFFGLDFDQMQYTEIASEPYTADQLLMMQDFDHCTAMGKDTFFGKQLDYEDFTVSTYPKNNWIRYYFNADGSLAGYAEYSDQALTSLMNYELFTSVYPDDAVVYFDIPAGFTKYDNIIEGSEFFDDPGMDDE